MLFRKTKIKNRIFELLTEIRETNKHNGLLIVFSDLNKIMEKGAIPIGSKEKDFNEIENIFSEKAAGILKSVGDDGAVLISKKGHIYSPSVYLNVNIRCLNENQINPEFAARHIAALATSATTKSIAYTLSEETGKVREFIKGKIKREYPEPEEAKILEIIKKDLKETKAS